MDIEKLLQLHNDSLDERVEREAFLGQRLKARLKTGSADPAWSPGWFPKAIVTYGLGFAILVSMHFVWIGKVFAKNQPVRAQNPFGEFSRVYAGKDITQAFAEVLKWGK